MVDDDAALPGGGGAASYPLFSRPRCLYFVYFAWLSSSGRCVALLTITIDHATSTNFRRLAISSTHTTPSHYHPTTLSNGAASLQSFLPSAA